MKEPYRRGTPERAELVAEVSAAQMEAWMADTVLTVGKGSLQRRKASAVWWLAKAERRIRKLRAKVLQG
jgi:hypothetical protein